MKNLVVVGKNTCQACDAMKSWLDSQGIGYLYVNGLQSAVWMARMRDEGLRSFPQAFADDKLVGGLDALQTLVSQR